MIREFLSRYNFATVPRDRWLASEGRLSDVERRWLLVRERRLAQYNFVKAIALFPIAVVRGCINAVRILREFETLHAAPRRHIRMGRDCVIDQQTWLVNGRNIELGESVKISAFSTVIAGYRERVRIGSNAIIGPGVTIVAINHGAAQDGGPIRYQPWDEAPVEIGEDVWIGAGVVILPGTTIGAGAVVGAGTVVKGFIPPRQIAYMRDGALTLKGRR